MKPPSIIAPLWLALAGCAQVLDIPDDPTVVGPWRCVGEEPVIPVPRATTALVQVQACDFFDNCTTAVTGLTARLCLYRDAGCTNPQQEGIVDVNGLLSFEVPTRPAFNGYLEVTSSTEYCTSDAFGTLATTLCGLAPDCHPEALDDNCRFPVYARAMMFFNPPIYNDPPSVLQLPLLPARAIPLMVDAAGAELNPTTGNLFITALDCDGARASGVTFNISQHQDVVTQLYLKDGLPNKVYLETDASGIGGFLGVPAGFVNVSAFNGIEEIGATGVHSRPFTMTYTVISPLAPPPPSL